MTKKSIILVASAMLVGPCTPFQPSSTTTKTTAATTRRKTTSSSPTGTDSRALSVPTLEQEENCPDPRPLYDPFRLYPESSPERMEGRIRGLEPRTVKAIKPIVDPLGLYPASAFPKAMESGDDGKDVRMEMVEEDVDMSESLPFLPRPIHLTKELAGDVGFDPLNLANSKERLMFMRESELKHARIAMLAAVGWPASELFNRPLAEAIHMKSLLLSSSEGDRVPSLLNGGLGHVSPFYWMMVLGLVGGFEIAHQVNPGDGEDGKFDPFNIFPSDDDAKGQMWWETAEIKNGRLAMLAIVGFAIQEWATKMSVIHQIPFLSSF